MEAKQVKKPTDKKFVMIAGIIILIVIATVTAIVLSRGKHTNSRSSSVQEIEEKLNINIKEPEEAESISYDIENNTIAKVSYTKTISSGQTMHFVMRSSSSVEEDLANLGPSVDFVDQPIFMTTACDDGSEIEVEAYVALDDKGDMKYMKALWMDNDKYYSMVTDDLITREDFLQEVNRVIISNHIPF